MDTLEYKGYEGTAELDMTRQICRGKILFINDLVTYEADSPANLQKEFEIAVDDYIETCAMLNREPQKPLQGQFNVRIPPDLHRAALLRAKKDAISLNEVVVRALDACLNTKAETNHNVHVTIEHLESPRTRVSSASLEQPNWEHTYVSH